MVAGMDEVGRGALAGPVCVGVVVVTSATSEPPEGLADSKLLEAGERSALIAPLQKWAHDWSLGWASAAEIDSEGLVAALRMAGLRALEGLREPPLAVVLDGRHDWLTVPADLFSPQEADYAVHMQIKADQTCASVAAASVLAKVARDQAMVRLAKLHPEYGWTANKGYGTRRHAEALSRFGPSTEHRRTWALPTTQDGPDVRG
jgi:ribonuclease HII